MEERTHIVTYTPSQQAHLFKAYFTVHRREGDWVYCKKTGSVNLHVFAHKCEVIPPYYRWNYTVHTERVFKLNDYRCRNCNAEPPRWLRTVAFALNVTI
jgi:hypothetical protein